MEHSTLLLNADYQPIKIIPWTRAVHMWFSEKVEIIESYDDFDLKSMTLHIKCPAVVRLLQYVKRKDRKVKFSRVNVFGRDAFRCQYCKKQPGTTELTYDHVLPRAQGGKTTWENIATACLSCNGRKGNRTPSEAGMPLMKRPVRPKSRPFNHFKVSVPKTPDSWRSYLWWHQELENENGG